MLVLWELGNSGEGLFLWSYGPDVCSGLAPWSGDPTLMGVRLPVFDRRQQSNQIKHLGLRCRVDLIHNLQLPWALIYIFLIDTDGVYIECSGSPVVEPQTEECSVED